MPSLIAVQLKGLSMHTPSPTPPQPQLPIAGRNTTFTGGRVFCVGRNYAAHVKEMGSTGDAIFFMKPATALVPLEDFRADIPYPAETDRFDHEIELVIALGAAGRPNTEADARGLIFGYAAGIDLTRRDVQNKLKDEGSPWEASKAFEYSAPLSAIRPAEDIGHPRAGRIWLSVNGEIRQDANLKDMTLSPEALLVALARTWALLPGDVIFTGTPAGVGPLTRGQIAKGGVEGVGEVEIRVV
jgi:fumarylpyruvate hydrolase